MIRSPAAAGTFYSMGKEDLEKELEHCFAHKVGPGLPSKQAKKDFLAGVAPHAGYVYSGPIAAHLYKKIGAMGKIDTFIILGPNHTGVGAPISIFAEGAWATPLGQIGIDSELANKIIEDYPAVIADDTAHFQEHSIEVQLPFLQYVQKDFKIVPICMMAQDYRTAADLGQCLARAVVDHKKVGVIASSDFTHYEPYPVAKETDLALIKPLQALNIDLFYDLLAEKNATVCGPGPIAAAATYALSMNAKKGNLLKYATSGDTAGDKKSVVGYAAIEFE